MTSIPISNPQLRHVAHIDHGNRRWRPPDPDHRGLPAREMKEQVLDSMDIERERGITSRRRPCG